MQAQPESSTLSHRRVAPHDARGARIEHLERRTLSYHATAWRAAARDRVTRVELEPEIEPGVELVVGTPRGRAHGEEQVLNGEAARVVERHQRAPSVTNWRNASTPPGEAPA